MSPEVLLIIEIALIVVGLIGTIVPALPGILLVYSSVLVQHFFDPNLDYPVWLLITLGIFTLIVISVQYIFPAIGTKKFGASKYAIWGSIVGLLAGIFIPGIGLLIGPFIGAVLGELIFARKSFEDSLWAGVGAFIGIVASTFFEIVCSLIIVGVFIYYNVQ